MSGISGRSSKTGPLSASPNSESTPMSCSLRRETVRLISSSCTSSNPCLGCPKLSKAPALISDSTVLLFKTEVSQRSKKLLKSSKGPALSRSCTIKSTKPSPTLRIAERPKTIFALSPLSPKSGIGVKEL